ncbi:thioredoxin family protein [Sphingomonas sp.]|uniref:thioredoxin family protein n=1 Tax=Sphingomonas sp. TaxID=28214 RepID=UPI001B146A65|nr:thioredoxin family protein [Sphingomonas sp.]MBO9714661.1 thioredoxin family protein [Sphingomonas sp.]
MRLKLFLALPSALLLTAALAPGEPAPKMSIGDIQQLHTPLPAPYRPGADATTEVKAALERAKARGKPLLIDFGANWCLDCRVLAGVLEVPELKAYVARNFELVQVDVGRFDHNIQIAQGYTGEPLGAIPAVFVVDPATGKLRNRRDTLGLGDARVMKPQAIANWLAKWGQ